MSFRRPHITVMAKTFFHPPRTNFHLPKCSTTPQLRIHHRKRSNFDSLPTTINEGPDSYRTLLSCILSLSNKLANYFYSKEQITPQLMTALPYKNALFSYRSLSYTFLELALPSNWFLHQGVIFTFCHMLTIYLY